MVMTAMMVMTVMMKDTADPHKPFGVITITIVWHAQKRPISQIFRSRLVGHAHPIIIPHKTSKNNAMRNQTPNSSSFYFKRKFCTGEMTDFLGGVTVTFKYKLNFAQQKRLVG